MSAPQPPLHGTERDLLLAFLDYYRAIIADKAGGLDAEQLDTRLGPSTLTLGGIVHHLALVENWWFHQCFAGNEEAGPPWDDAPWDDDRDWDFHAAADLDPATILGRYAREVERSRAILADAYDLEQMSARTDRRGAPFSLRWILIHMIEETARHAGHADLIRESIDGETGDFRAQD